MSRILCPFLQSPLRERYWYPAGHQGGQGAETHDVWREAERFKRESYCCLQLHNAREERARLFSKVQCNRTWVTKGMSHDMGNLNWIQGKKKFTVMTVKYWNKLSTEIIESPSWDNPVKKTHLGTALSNLTQVVPAWGFGLCYFFFSWDHTFLCM